MTENYISEIWMDPVWSKVIASGLIFIISQAIVFVWGIIQNIGFLGVYKKIYNNLKRKFSKVEIKGKNKDSDEIFDEPDILEKEIHEAPTVFFHYRFCDAFPGFDSGYQRLTSRKDIKLRLKTLLAYPTRFNKAIGHGVTSDPIWWFRGSSALPIERFRILNRKKILINIDELIIEKIVAYRGRSYFEDFVYVQCLPDTPTGLYNHNQLYLETSFNDYGEYHEEFGIYKKRYIKRQEYDDGSAIIKGKPVRIYN
ncbi:MAG: hypothetical protein K8R79_01245, partial [Calditrichales bacterium]|nr:hypothetical protein [Calditrichales bacterium]